MTTTPITTAAPTIERDRYGRPKVIPPDQGADAKKVSYTRCTTFVSVLEDRYNLEKWLQRMVATGLAQRPDLVLAAAAAQDNKSKLNGLCDDAIEAAKGKAAATTGTALHTLTEMLDRGQPLPTQSKPTLPATSPPTRLQPQSWTGSGSNSSSSTTRCKSAVHRTGSCRSAAPAILPT